MGGTWNLAGTPKRAVVEVVRWPSWERLAAKDLAAEVDRLAAFLDRPLAIEISVVG